MQCWRVATRLNHSWGQSAILFNALVSRFGSRCTYVKQKDFWCWDSRLPLKSATMFLTYWSSLWAWQKKYLQAKIACSILLKIVFKIASTKIEANSNKNDLSFFYTLQNKSKIRRTCLFARIGVQMAAAGFYSLSHSSNLERHKCILLRIEHKKKAKLRVTCHKAYDLIFP